MLFKRCCYMILNIVPGKHSWIHMQNINTVVLQFQKTPKAKNLSGKFFQSTKKKNNVGLGSDYGSAKRSRGSWAQQQAGQRSPLRLKRAVQVKTGTTLVANCTRQCGLCQTYTTAAPKVAAGYPASLLLLHAYFSQIQIPQISHPSCSARNTGGGYITIRFHKGQQCMTKYNLNPALLSILLLLTEFSTN